MDLVLGMNWFQTVNPIVDWCGAKLYVPNAVHAALPQGNWLEDYVKVGTVIVLSSEEELDKLKDERTRSSISVLKAPKFWKWQDEKINSRANLSKGGEWFLYMLMTVNYPIIVKIHVMKKEDLANYCNEDGSGRCKGEEIM